MFAGAMLEEAFLRAIVRGACQARKPYEQWYLVLGIAHSLRGQVEIECHVATSGLSQVAQFQELAAEARNSCFRSDGRHFRITVRDYGV
jgi:hypothetical protein